MQGLYWFRAAWHVLLGLCAKEAVLTSCPFPYQPHHFLTAWAWCPCSYPHKHKFPFKHHFLSVFLFVSESTEKAECPCSHRDTPLHFQPVVWLLKRRKPHPWVISTVGVVNWFKIKCHWCCWKVVLGFVIALKKIWFGEDVSGKEYWFFVHCLQQKRSWGCSFHKGCCKFCYLLERGVSVKILRRKPFNVRKWLYLIHSKRSSCASSLVGEIGTSSPAS